VPTRALVLIIAAGGLAAAIPAISEAQAIAWSQFGSVTQRLGDVEMTIRYRRPVARGRELFGTLVPWQQAWAPGADSATTIAFSGDVLVDGNRVPAGTYSIWMIPSPGDWTVILSRAAHVYHTPYPGGRDLLRLTVAPEQALHVETLSFTFPLVDGPRAELAFQWGETRVVIPIAIEVEDGTGI